MQDLFIGFDIGTVYENGNCAAYDSKTAKTFEAYRTIENFVHVQQDMDIPFDGCLSEARLIVAYDRAKGCWPESRENDNSILLRLHYGNTSFLFTGDCERNCEEELLAQSTTLEADFLKVGHHGSDTSSTDAFLDEVNAKYYVISVDERKSASEGYFHPKSSTLKRIERQSSAGIFRTDINGRIVVVSDGNKIVIDTESG
jgi:beta-lactamase superfamily II metal-dependent hydrolase